MEIYFNPHDLKCKSPFGAVSNNETVSFSIYCKDGVFVNNITLRVYFDERDEYVDYPLNYVNSKDGYSCFNVEVNDLDVGLYWYHFNLSTEEGDIRFDDDNKGFQLTIFDQDYNTPDDIKGGIIYHIFVDRFNKGNDPKAVFNKKGVLKNWNDPLTLKDTDGVYRANDFYGGNFQGIIDKLDYLKSLNVNMIYLSPIFKSSSNHRYDTGNYHMLDELLGDEEKFKELIDKAKEKGISIMLDGVFNHTGADSLYFNKFNTYNSIGAYQSQQSPYYNWYTFYDFPDNYHCWWGVTVCPTIKPVPNGFRDLITNPINGVIKKWTSMGVKGWRLDVVDELQEIFVKEIRKTIKKCDKNAVMIGEVWEDASNKIAYEYRRHYFQGEELDGVMNYVFKDAILNYTLGGSAIDFKKSIDSIVEHYPKQSLDVSMNLIGTHDTVRALTALGCEYVPQSKEERQNYVLNDRCLRTAIKRMKIASSIQYILPGIPSIYYGDEIGMQGFEDPLNRQTMKWDAINNELLSHYKALGEIRKKYKEEILGDINIKEDDYLIIERKNNDSSIILLANSGEKRASYLLDGEYVDLLSRRVFNDKRIVIDPLEVYILRKK